MAEKQKEEEYNVEKRIEELEAEIQNEQRLLAQHNQAVQQLQTSIVSKNGALVELRKLVK